MRKKKKREFATLSSFAPRNESAIGGEAAGTESLPPRQSFARAGSERVIEIEKDKRGREAEGLELGVEARIPHHDLFLRNEDLERRLTPSKRTFADIGAGGGSKAGADDVCIVHSKNGGSGGQLTSRSAHDTSVGVVGIAQHESENKNDEVRQVSRRGNVHCHSPTTQQHYPPLLPLLLCSIF